MATFLLLLAWLLIKLGTAIAIIVVFTLTIRTISETWPSAYQGTNFVDISDNTLKALHHNYQQLHSQIRALFSQRGLLLRGHFSTETSAPPQSEPTSHDHVSWWSLFTDLTSTIIEIDLVACRAILGVFATIVSSIWSTSSSFLGLPDSHRDIDLTPVIEPSGASSLVSL
ncbi:hypothetical protein H0H93_006557 [Arthromyces matolae]|nr:hypothetical protein H0H93_006557 [Arthromyces matolae]